MASTPSAGTPHFVCSRPDADDIVTASGGDSSVNGACLRVTATQFNAYNRADATLSGLTLSAGALDPVFAPGTTTYAVSVASSVDTVTVTPTATNAAGNAAGATITVNAAGVDSGSASNPIDLTAGMPRAIPIVVTSADGANTMTYTVTATRAMDTRDASLSRPDPVHRHPDPGV